MEKARWKRTGGKGQAEKASGKARWERPGGKGQVKKKPWLFGLNGSSHRRICGLQKNEQRMSVRRCTVCGACQSISCGPLLSPTMREMPAIEHPRAAGDWRMLEGGKRGASLPLLDCSSAWLSARPLERGKRGASLPLLDCSSAWLSARPLPILERGGRGASLPLLDCSSACSFTPSFALARSRWPRSQKYTCRFRRTPSSAPCDFNRARSSSSRMSSSSPPNEQQCPPNEQ